MKNKLYLGLILLFAIFTFAPNTFAQDYTQMSLPEGAKARLGKGWISGDIAYSPDGTRLAVASSIGIWIYDANTYAEITLLTGHTERVNSVAFSPDGKKLISGGHDKTVRLWNAETSSLSTSELLHTLEDHTDYVLSVAFSPEGNKFASSDGDLTIRLWDTHTNQVLHTLKSYDSYYYHNETNWVYDIAFSIDGKTLASADRNGRARLWDVNTGEHILNMSRPSRGWGVKSVAYSSDGVTLAIGDGDGYVRLWGARTGEFWQTVGSHVDGRNYGVNDLAFSPDGNILVSGGNDNKLKLWDTFTGEHLRTLEGHSNGILGVTFSPDGSTIASASWTEIRFWNANTGINLHTIQGHTRSVYSSTFSPDGNLLASGDSGGRIMLRNPNSGQLIHTFQRNGMAVRAVAFSPDGSMLASGHQSQGTKEDQHIMLWNVMTRNELYSFDEHFHDADYSRDYGAFSVAFSPDGETLASGGGEYIYLWDVKTGERKQNLVPKGSGIIYSISFSPDGQTFLSAFAHDRWNSGSIDLWLPRTGRRLRNIYEGHSYSATFSPDGSIIAGSVRDKVGFWDLRSGENLMTLTGHTEYITEISFSPDGQTIASGSLDNTIRLYDVNMGDNKQTFIGHTSDVSDVSFSQDGTMLASGSLDGTILLWDLTLTETTGDTPSTPTTSDATMSISATPVQAHVIGELLTFLLNITDGENVAGYQATVQFDTTALQYVSSENGDYLPQGAFFVPPVVEGNKVTLAASSLAGENNGDGILATLTFELVAAKTSTLTLSEVSLVNSDGVRSHPNIVENTQIEIIEASYPPEDINKDGVVNILDLVAVASNFGKTGDNSADVNEDGVVDIIDLVLVAGAIGNTAGAPSNWGHDLKVAPTRTEVQQWLIQAQRLDVTDATSRQGILILEQLLAILTPKATALLPNYPNPFNPETWIPYQLAEPADVMVTIYAVDGTLVRTLSLGHKPIGIYQSRTRAAYWDGKNRLGEPVASGVYFYTLTAGDFTATRQMLIRK